MKVAGERDTEQIMHEGKGKRGRENANGKKSRETKRIYGVSVSGREVKAGRRKAAEK